MSGALRVAFRTLGCKLNQYETEAIAAEFSEAGHTVVPFDESADVYVINSCTITGQADRKSRNLVYRALRHAGDGSPAPHHRATVVLTGCFSERHGTDFAADDRVLVVGNETKNALLPIVEARLGRREPAAWQAPDRFGFRAGRAVFHTRAAVKIQDGCDQFCTYCIVPHVRGRAVSRDVASVLEEIRRTVADGAREVVLTGVNLGRYYADGTTFGALLHRCLDELPADGSVRLRISSLEPDGLDEGFAEAFRDPRLAPHVHLCLQSGADSILERMNRRYRLDDFRRIALALRDVDPKLNLTTDIIVGFPGETEEEFAASLAAAEELSFSHIHVFPFSPREGTPAARMNNRIPAQVKQDRARRLRALSAGLKRRYYRSMVGHTEDVLVERADAVARGYGRYYLPVEIPAADLRQNEVYRVTLTELAEREGGPVLRGTLSK